MTEMSNLSHFQGRENFFSLLVQGQGLHISSKKVHSDCDIHVYFLLFLEENICYDGHSIEVSH